MKKFTENNVTYSKSQSLNDGIQYRANYEDGQYSLAFIYGKKHTRKQVIEAVNDVNERSINSSSED